MQWKFWSARSKIPTGTCGRHYRIAGQICPRPDHARPSHRAADPPFAVRRLRLGRDRAADALASVADDKVIEALVQALVTDERDVRYHAAQAIANARATSALPKLSEHRHDQNPEVRERIIIIFGQIGGSEQVPAVIEATNDTEPQVQLAAVNALRQLRERGATISLVPRLKDPNPHVRAAVCARSVTWATRPSARMFFLFAR